LCFFLFPHAAKFAAVEPYQTVPNRNAMLFIYERGGRCPLDRGRVVRSADQAVTGQGSYPTQGIYKNSKSVPLTPVPKFGHYAGHDVGGINLLFCFTSDGTVVFNVGWFHPRWQYFNPYIPNPQGGHMLFILGGLLVIIVIGVLAAFLAGFVMVAREQMAIDERLHRYTH
jgi:hypothetical protein